MNAGKESYDGVRRFFRVVSGRSSQ